MLNSKVKTGPKTLAGKKRSAQNAIKSGVYATTLLSGEVHSDYKEMRDALIEDYEAYDALGLSAVEEVVMTYVRKKRIVNAETQYLSGVMQTEEAREALCEKLYGDKGLKRVTPWWYLELGPCPEKRTADVIYKAFLQLKKFKNKGGYQTDQAFGFAYPELYTVVMWFQEDSAKSFPQTLTALTGKPDMASGLKAFEETLRKEYLKHIEWAQNASRYQKVVEMVYAEFAMRVMSKPEMIKLTNALNRQTEHALSVLHARGQLIEANQGSLTLQVAQADGPNGQSQAQIVGAHDTITGQATDTVSDAQSGASPPTGQMADSKAAVSKPQEPTTSSELSVEAAGSIEQVMAVDEATDVSQGEQSSADEPQGGAISVLEDLSDGVASESGHD